jgi:hypothetical protein
VVIAAGGKTPTKCTLQTQWVFFFFFVERVLLISGVRCTCSYSVFSSLNDCPSSHGYSSVARGEGLLPLGCERERERECVCVCVCV